MSTSHSPLRKHGIERFWSNLKDNGLYENNVFTIDPASWSSETVTIDGTAYYTYVITLAKVNDGHPVIGIAAAGTLPTEAEQKAYDCVNYVIVTNVDENTMTLYAKKKPTSRFSIIVKGAK